MNIKDLCPPDQVELIRSLLHDDLIHIQQGPFSKKKLFENIAARFADHLEGDDDAKEDYEDEILDSLLARERLGSTALGKGIALPHGRVSDLDAPSLCLMKIDGEAVIYDEEHTQPVWFVVALIVPSDEKEQHLKIYAALTRCLQDDGFFNAIKQAADKESVLRLFK